MHTAHTTVKSILSVYCFEVNMTTRQPIIREQEITKEPHVDLAEGEREVIHPALTPREPERNAW
jgi:hypothetical protein